MNTKILQDKVAIVTGAGMGMGAATARLFAEAGARVVVADVNESAGRQIVEEIVAAGGEAFFQRANVSVAADVEALVAAAVSRYGRLDVAVNNAAVTPDAKPLAEMDEADFDRVIAVDLKGVALCLKYELAQMIRQGQGGSIINIGSVSSFRPQPTNGAYVAAKHGVIGLTKVAALENGGHNIRVNAVAPGAIDTPMLRGALDAMKVSEAEYAPTRSLLNRFGAPTEVAQASLWLASDLSSYVTGSTIHVDAGYANR
ncbi:MAG: SDR family NAD(P)-dependent oxidoreductase [Aromatoleum sp.]|jgi:glucose 1-dehydrogenase|uniref:SDR family NAD(P)-dependent oxidoreductase n=1 Tax=Aromatoleum sp. TaxID=2307007 RepID=UPI002893A8B4|nr:SDR family NAD(P)-dependent oxidoreductase [Aromatoleum sp.]MDT3671008.1 SDR family NAD(P)-dependent oxidoreductase [Aromatoleum sp.]